ncbi:MAG: ECF-type riboflavin transporter substrate-binding protein [Clostridia bacterium]|nr:ECF-type riboflavin transporter substrate-binding protein [Clostridia bacterium]
MEKPNAFLASLVSLPGLVCLVAALLTAFLLMRTERRKGRTLTKARLLAAAVGALLYGFLSIYSLPIGSNTTLRPAVAILTVTGAVFGPTAGFLAGFVGHALNDALAYGSVWWSWAFLSAMVGLFGGLVALDHDFDALKGLRNNLHGLMMYIHAVLGLFAGSFTAFIGDMLLYHESAQKVWIEIILAGIANFSVISLVGIPLVFLILRLRVSKGKES